MSDTQQLVIFSLAGEEYALPITRVQEIIRYAQPRSVASSMPWIRGVINLRGKIVPVCDLAMRLGVSHTHADTAKIAVIETHGGAAGVVVDSVAKLDGRLPILLNPDGLLSGIELAA